MPSQEDYLDQLLRNLTNGGQEQPQDDVMEPDAGEIPQASTETPEMSDASAVLEEAMGVTEEIPDVSAVLEEAMEPTEEIPDVSAVLEEAMGTTEEMPDVSAILEEAMEPTEEMPDVSAVLEEAMEPTEEIPDVSAVLEEAIGTTEEIPDMSAVLEGAMEPTEEIPDVSAILEEAMEPTEEMPDVSAVLEEAMEAMGTTEEIPDVPAVLEEAMGVTEEMPDVSAILEEAMGMTETSEMEDTPSGIEEAIEMPDDTQGESETSAELEEIMKMTNVSEMTLDQEEVMETADMSGISDMSVELDAPADAEQEDSDIAELLKSLEDVGMSDESAEIPEESMAAFPDMASEEDSVSPEAVDISSMSEEDIDRLLAQGRESAESGADTQAEEFQGDVVDMLEGTEDSDLQEIQDLLEKSDNNEAVGDEIRDILERDSQESGDNSVEGAGEQLTPKQQKAMEKKRLKEEKAAARKAEKAAKKAEKEAKKAARRAKKNKEGGLDGEDASGVESFGEAETSEPIDTTFLDSILSEAGKIDGTETISSATGNYDVKVDNIITDEDGESGVGSGTRNTARASSANAGLGVDLNNLFGDSAAAEDAMMAGGPDFVALDGDDVTGIIELTGGVEEEEKPKKKGFFSRFLEFLTEEDEEEEENENIQLSEENQEILEDLDKEKGKKDKKGKKGKKKGKKADASADGGEDGEEGGEDKGKKGKKKKKPKKEKLPKEEEPVDPRNRLSLKKVLPVVLICLSLCAAIIILSYASVDFTDKKAARDAYYAGDYQTCYQNLYGKDMNENEQVMYGKSECVLLIRLWIREYEMLLAEGAQLEALDSLIQSVNDYPALYERAAQWNATGEVAQEYDTILNLLYGNYGLTEEQARAIAAEPNDIEYTRQVNAIVQGGAYGSWNEPEPVVELPLADELPEETELPGNNFIDTNTAAR